MMGLTARQRDLLAFIGAYQAGHDGIAPSFDEMACALDLKSKAGVHRLVSGLVERGVIRKLPNRARTMQIISPKIDLSGVPTAALQAELARRAS